MTLLLYVLLSVPDNDYELISIRTLEIPTNFNILFGTFCVWALLSDFTPPNANLTISLQTSRGPCEVIKVRFAQKLYGFLSPIILSCADNAIFELLFRVAHLY